MKIFTITLLLILTTFSNVYSQDFWEKTAWPDTITIYSLAINSSGDIFAGTSMNGVLRSTDNGNNWTNLGIMNYDIHTVAISSNGDIYSAAFQWGGIFRSTDNGNNWINLGLYHFDYSIAINSNGDIFVGTGAFGIWRTTDNGENWVQILFGSNCSGINSLIINSSGDIFAGTIQGGVFRSTDNGDNWIQIIQGMTELQILSLAINSSGDIFAGTSGGGIFRSTDNGDNWVQINQGINGQGLFTFSLAINSNGDIFAGTADGVFRSSDNGDEWIQNNQGLTNNDVHSLAINSNGDIFAGTEGGLFRSNNQTTFQFSIDVLGGWNMLSIPGLRSTNQNTITWWPGKDTTADVFKYQGIYEPVSTLEPDKGYWMKNLTAQTYNYSGIITVPNDPIPMTSGWNLFGVYECPVPVNTLTTTPPGLISGQIYKLQW